MTRDLGYQVEVFDKEEALRYFKSSDYKKDCRINAYPTYTEYHGINRTPVGFLTVDLDLKDFGSEKVSKKTKLVVKIDTGFSRKDCCSLRYGILYR